MDIQINTKTESRIISKGSFLEMNRESILVRHNTWNLQTVENIKFYFDKEIAIEYRERVTANVVESLGKIVGKNINSKQRITFWVFSSLEQKQLLTNNEMPMHCIPEYNAIYTYFNQALTHKTLLSEI